MLRMPVTIVRNSTPWQPVLDDNTCWTLLIVTRHHRVLNKCMCRDLIVRMLCHRYTQTHTHTDKHTDTHAQAHTHTHIHTRTHTRTYTIVDMLHNTVDLLSQYITHVLL